MAKKSSPTLDGQPSVQQKLAAQSREQQSEIVKQAKGKRGQPTKFTQELWDNLLDRLACCENIVDICSEPNMPSFYTVRKWWRKDPELKAQVEDAWKDASYLMHYVNDSMLSGGVMSTNDFKRDDARAANNRWFMGKIHRNLWGDKTQVEVTQVDPYVINLDAIQGLVVPQLPKPEDD